MLEEVRRFHKNLPRMTNDQEIAKRLQKAVETALRNAYYDLIYNENKKVVLKEHLISAMIDERAFERAKNKNECIQIAERIAEEIIKVGGKDLKKFCDLYVKWNNAKHLLE
ncbi:MAG: hypothetical protein QW540_09480 [Archaeoglobaceae archaeon]